MSDNQIIRHIRQTPECEKLWNRCSDAQKREVMRQAEGDVWRLADLIRDVLEMK